MRDIKVNGRKIMKEQKRFIETNGRERKSDSQRLIKKRESEGEADKEYVMKLCSAGSVKGSNLLIKDRD